MKTFVMLKLPILLCCVGGALAISPVCKAQSEVAPDHFEGGTAEPFEKLSMTAVPATTSAHQKPAAAQSQAIKSNSTQTMQLTAAHDVSTPAGQNAAIENKRKTATRKSKKQ